MGDASMEDNKKQTALDLGAADYVVEATVEKYQFEPIQGYPMLHWKGKRPFRSTQYYPAQLKEQYGEPVDGWMNRLYWGDNLQVMSHLLKEFRGKINLIYIDPPFDSKADYKKKISVTGSNINNDNNAFEEKQYTDIWNNDEYLQFIYERLLLMRELLSEKGSILIHCDWHKSHHIRTILDEIFGSENFVNEIIWQKIRTSKTQSASFGNVHDTIFFYKKTASFFFKNQYIETDPNYIRTHYKMDDETGKMIQLVSLLQRGQGPARRFGDKVLQPPIDMHWIWSQERIDEAMTKGLIRFTSNGLPRKVQFLDDMKGDIIDDLWIDIYPVNSQAKEKENYPTQKPVKLLERIIDAASEPGDIVFDGFMGSGTTLAAAMKLGRRFIGTDINVGSIQTTTNRIITLGEELSENQIRDSSSDDGCEIIYTGFSVFNVNHYDIFRNPVEAKDLLMDALEIQPLPGDSLYDGEKDGYMVKIMPVNRIATRADLSTLVTNFDQKLFSRRQTEHPGQPVERIMLVCMGHEPGLGAALEADTGYKLDVKVVDILRDKSKLEFKREAEAKVVIKDNQLVIEQFFPMNLLQKLSLMQEEVEDWRQLVETVMVDWNYDGTVLKPAVIDNPDKNELVAGTYDIPAGSKRIRVKITDLLSESLEVEVDHG